MYLVTPLVVPLVWWRNRPHDPGAIEGDVAFPPWIRRAMVGAGVAMSVIAMWLYVEPSSAIDVWPWPLTDLTARALAAFVALPGVAWLAIAADDRWSAAQVMLATVSVGLVLLLVAVARAWDEFDHGNPWSYVYVAGLVATLAAIGALALFMRARARA